MATEVRRVDADPLLAVLTAVRDTARVARDTDTDMRKDFIALGRRAHAALRWLEFDEAGLLELAGHQLDIVYDR